jgi:hypothetical protein
MRLIVLSLLAAIAGCAETFPMPMTAAEMAAHDSGPALVAYLGQADASPTVCDLRAGGPHLATVDDDARKALVRALGDGAVAPELWRRCVNALARSSPPADAAALVDAVGRGYRTLIRRRDFEKTPELQQRLAVMQRFYIERKNGLDGDAAVDGKLFAELRRALDAHKLGPAATASGEELEATFELEQGSFRGRPVDVPMIDGLFGAGDEPTLMRFTNRLPEPSLREAARRRVIRLHIAASPFPEVRAAAATVEEAVAQKGVWALSLAEHPPLRGWLDLPKVPMRGVLVRQHVWEQTATLLGYTGDRPGLSVLPELALRGALLVEAQGISRPVTLCSSPRKLDPSPCLDVHDVTLANPMAYLDKGGAFHFVDHVAMRDAVNLAQMGNRFVLPLSVGGRRMLTFDWSLYYERPADVVFGGGAPLHVVVDHRDPARFVFTIGGAGASRLAVVESGDSAAFHVISRGADGAPGSPGSAGASGSSGGECSDGSPGGDGGPGGPGGDGGDGGDIVVDVTCAGASCDAATMASVRAMVLSVGGDGGPGGAGGSGGMGGAGGSGRSPTTHTDDNGNTITDDPGCSAGSSGASGASGSPGSPGSPGRPGHVRFRVF